LFTAAIAFEKLLSTFKAIFLGYFGATEKALLCFFTFIGSKANEIKGSKIF